MGGIADYLNTAGNYLGITPPTQSQAQPQTEPQAQPPADTPTTIPVWRYNENTKNNLETTPLHLDQDEIYNNMKNMGIAEAFGGPKIDPSTAMRLLMREGREDFGNDGIEAKNPKIKNSETRLYYVDPNMTKNVKLYDQLLDNGLDPLTAGMATHWKEKQDLSSKTGKSFAYHWNGKGKDAENYAKVFEASLGAANHPSNKEAYALINKALNDGRAQAALQKQGKVKVTPQTQYKSDNDFGYGGLEKKYKKGGFIDKPIQGGKKDI